MRAINGLLRRHGLLIAEVVVLAGLNIEQVVTRLLTGGPAAGEILYFCVGAVIGALALLRHRFPGRLTELAAAAVALSLLCSLVGVLVQPGGEIAGDIETLGLLLLVGSSCHHLAPHRAGAAAVLGGLAIVVAPVLRYGTDRLSLTVAVLWAILWGCSVAVGLVLRDSDARREAAQAAARNRERLMLARELHDLVAHHITGVVVRTQAARVVLDDGTERELLEDIERAGAEALSAVRRLVMMLRSPEQQLPPAGDLVETVEAAVDGDEAVTVRLAPELADLAVAPEVVSTVHRVVLESLSNVRKHAPEARQVTVTVEPTAGADRQYLRVEVWNDGTRASRSRHRSLSDGYGLVGMSERIDALDGRLTVGEHGEHGWRVLAELPLPGYVAARPPEERTPQ
ncbi:sensor histidine kinase [Kribbella sp. CA-247076]|uniref:sensor histidine kinase n=1 Tax=Kribbella sp. CA-247076 TaxID=3239941 RepID=UPI003D8AF672